MTMLEAFVKERNEALFCGIKDAPEAIVSKAKAWLREHGMSPYLAG